MRSIEQAFASPAPSMPRSVQGSRERALRLTRRGRLVVVLLVLALATLTSVLFSRASQAAGPATAPRTVTVQAHETLWQLAARLDPQRDPRTVVLALERANGLPGATVLPGEQLRVPSGL